MPLAFQIELALYALSLWGFLSAFALAVNEEE